MQTSCPKAAFQQKSINMNGKRPTQTDLLTHYQSALNLLAEEGLLRRCRTVEMAETATPDSGNNVWVRVEGQMAVNFSSNDYLGLAQDERLKQAAIEAVQTYGTGSGASRLVSGTNDLVRDLEEAVARFKQCEAALVLNSGYQANVAILQAMLAPGDWVFCDKLNHASLVDGCRLAGARWARYRHLDLDHLESRLSKAPPEAYKWIVTDSVFSMDGDYPDMLALAELSEKFGALLMVDEAHATGIYGDLHSSGLCEMFDITHRVALQMGTFSKALGGSGAYVAGSQVLIDTLINRARGFIYSTAQSPAVLGAAKRAVEIIQSDPDMKHQLWKNISLFEQNIHCQGLAAWFSLPLKGPIIPLVVGEGAECLRISQALLDAGFFVQAIRPPSVPAGTARLRITLSAGHSASQIESLLQTLARVLKTA